MTSRLPWAGMALGCCALGAIFHAEILAAIAVWSDSTAYGHCWLVLPIVAWLIWERRDIVLARPPQPALWPVFLALPLIPLWLLAYWLGLMEGRQLAVFGFVEILLMAGMGWRLWWGLSAALLYLVFLVPFGAFLTPALQHVTAAFIVHGLAILHVPYEADSFRITIPEGSFYVAEACAGLRFLIASIAFAALYAVTMFRSPLRRAVFIAMSSVVPVIANGVRGLGIVLLGHALGSAQAGAADHIIYGWVFFSAVILLLALCGLPFRQAMAPLMVADPSPPKVRAVRLAGCAAVVVLAIAGPAASTILLGYRVVPMAALVPNLSVPVGCSALDSNSSGPVSTQHFSCGANSLKVTTTLVPRRTNPARILQAGWAPAKAGLRGEVDTQVERIGGANWVLMTGADQGGVAAYAVWIDGVQSVGGLRERMHMAQDMFSAGPAPVAITVSVAPGQLGASDALRGFLAQMCAGKGGCLSRTAD